MQSNLGVRVLYAICFDLAIPGEGEGGTPYNDL